MFNDVTRWVKIELLYQTTFAMATKYTLVGNACSACITSDRNDIATCGVNWPTVRLWQYIPLAFSVSYVLIVHAQESSSHVKTATQTKLSTAFLAHCMLVLATRNHSCVVISALVYFLED